MTAATDEVVGRHIELAMLSSLVEGQRPRSVLIEGEAGVGKTTLVEEFLVHSGDGAQVLKGGYYDGVEAAPYEPFHQILGQLSLGRLPSASAPADEAARALRLSFDTPAKRSRYLTLLSDAVLRSTSSRETFLWIEDLQWADKGTLLLLDLLLDAGREFPFLICTARLQDVSDAEVRHLITRIQQKGHALKLEGLTLSETRELVARLANEERLTDQELQSLHSFTGGNPLFVRETYMHLRESGLLGRHRVQEAMTRSPTPEPLTHVIDLRTRTLPTRTQELLQEASAIGLHFSARLLSHMAGEPEHMVRTQLEPAVAKRVISPLDALDEPRYRFTHALFRMRHYDSLGPSRSQKAHRRIAEAIADGYALPYEGDIARHYALAYPASGNQTALRHCEAAAIEAERTMAFEVAARFWELALRCLTGDAAEARARLLVRLGQSLWAAGKWGQAGDAWRASSALFAALGDHEQVGRLALALGEMHRWRAEFSDAEFWLERALDELSRTSDAERGRASALLAGIRCRRDPVQGLKELDEANRLVSRSGEPDTVAMFWLSHGFLIGGEADKAYELAREGLSMAQEQGDTHATCLLAATLVRDELQNLNPTAAESNLRTLLEAVEKDDPGSSIRLLVSQAYFWGYRGRWKQVAQLCEQWMGEVRLASSFQVATARIFWAEAKLAIGEPQAAHHSILSSLPNLDEMRPVVLLTLAKAALRRGATEEAEELVRDSSSAVLGRVDSATGHVVLAEVSSRLDVPDLWESCYARMQREERAIVLAYAPVSTHRVLGRLATRLKRWAEATAHFEAAINELAAGQATWELVISYADYAEMRAARNRRGDATKAAAAELQARSILTDLGMPLSSSPWRPLALDGNVFGLTGRELEVLALAASGQRNREIAEALVLSAGTVNRHLENIYVKMSVSGRTEAVMKAAQHGLL